MNFPYHLPFVIDGITSCSDITGEDDDTVCSEHIVIHQPDMLISVKKRAVESGVNSLLSPTGGILHSRLKDLGYDEDFRDFITGLTGICVETGGKDSITGGVITHKQVGRTEYKSPAFEDCYFSYLEKMALLKESGASYILLKNHKDLLNMRAGVLAAKISGLPVLAVMEVDDEGMNDEDTDYISALVTLQALGASAFGIYCKDGITAQTALIERAFPHAEIPLIAVVNTLTDTKEQLQAVSESGAAVFIDTAQDMQSDKIAFLKSLPVKFDPDTPKDSYAAAIEREAFFLSDNLVLSEPVYCGYDMSDELIDLDDENINAVYIVLTSADDATCLADNAGMTKLPIVIHADEAVTLEAALRYFQGRLIVDTKCDIDRQKLMVLVQKYGAVLY